MKCLVIGYGSIGSRHAGILKDIGCQVSVVSHRNIEFPEVYHELNEALEQENPEYIVIANQTNQHHETLLEILNHNFNGTILVEKPLFHPLKEISVKGKAKIYVAYNLRFHPVIQKLREILNDHQALSAQIYVGQYLPNWRPKTDYSLNYSAHRELGGGVLRDLSHELDYANWLFGEWQRLVATGGHYSHLQINSEDVFQVMMTTKNCPVVSIQLNYLDHVGRREILINSDQKTLKGDLFNHTLQINDKIITFPIDKDFTYRSQHLAILEQNEEYLTRLEEGISVLKMIQAAEKSVFQRKWAENEDKKIMYDLR